ncbi:hypothetical protein GCM10011584_11430 [Nocardioides phosphati]|uniref:Uncharacterized protein n=1 Tax=Nocardioides phosphati TaxID=1867775 RepID=A0ABQ2N7G7_9ACTN|nr:hypothetical protein [Nocardioides phosphati]GGO87257.1 hypothetical protein GCM10011584_11430 [Nocardioides phosphati]
MSDEQRPEVGSVAEETAKLLGALSGWAKDHGSDLGAGLGGAFHDASEHLATGEDCKYCPFCRVVHIVRESSPEVRTHLAIAAASIAQAASAVLQAAVPEDAKASGGTHARRDPVEKIDLEDDDFGPFEGPFG